MDALIFKLGHHKCREDWPENSSNYERAYNLFLDGILLVVPLIMLAATYSLITKTLWQGMRTEKTLKKHLAFDSTHSCTYLSIHILSSTHAEFSVFSLLWFWFRFCFCFHFSATNSKLQIIYIMNC